MFIVAVFHDLFIHFNLFNALHMYVYILTLALKYILTFNHKSGYYKSF